MENRLIPMVTAQKTGNALKPLGTGSSQSTWIYCCLAHGKKKKYVLSLLTTTRDYEVPKQTLAHYVTGEFRFAFYLIQDELADKVEENGRHYAGEKR